MVGATLSSRRSIRPAFVVREALLLLIVLEVTSIPLSLRIQESAILARIEPGNSQSTVIYYRR